MAGLLATLLLAISTASLGVNAASIPEESIAKRDSVFSGYAGMILSTQCENTLPTLINSAASTCANLPGTVAILSTVANSSWIPPTNAWLTKFCAADTCTDDEIASTVGAAADGCTMDLGWIQVSKQYVIDQAVQHFSEAKEALCLRDSSASNNLCAIETLKALETALGAPLTPSLIQAKYPLLVKNNYALAKQLACTPCAAAAFTLVRPAIPQQFLSKVQYFISTECGANFLSTPTNGLSIVTGTQALLAAQATASPSSSTQISAGITLLSVVVGILSVATSLF